MSAPAPVITRTPLVIRYDLLDASSTIDLLVLDLEDDGGNALGTISKVAVELDRMCGLLEELERLVR